MISNNVSSKFMQILAIVFSIFLFIYLFYSKQHATTNNPPKCAAEPGYLFSVKSKYGKLSYKRKHEYIFPLYSIFSFEKTLDMSCYNKISLIELMRCSKQKPIDNLKNSITQPTTMRCSNGFYETGELEWVKQQRENGRLPNTTKKELTKEIQRHRDQINKKPLDQRKNRFLKVELISDTHYDSGVGRLPDAQQISQPIVDMKIV